MGIRLNVLPNACGECTLCCKVLAIKEFSKPKDEWCPHAVPKCGCAVYAARPPSCRQFKCGWLAHSFPPSLRPDKIHGLLMATSDGENLVVHEDPGYPGVASKALDAVIQKFIAPGKRFVIVVTGNKRRLLAAHGLAERIRFEDTDDPDKHHIVIEDDTQKESE
jgi:hypothetical protein